MFQIIILSGPEGELEDLLVVVLLDELDDPVVIDNGGLLYEAPFLSKGTEFATCRTRAEIQSYRCANACTIAAVHTSNLPCRLPKIFAFLGIGIQFKESDDLLLIEYAYSSCDYLDLIDETFDLFVHTSWI